MKHLDLIIPGLFPPPESATEACAGLELPALEKLLARGNADTPKVETFEDWFCAAFGVDSVAPVRAASDGLETGAAYWLCADPVSLHLQQSRMLVLPEEVASKEDAELLCAVLNGHFSETGLRFFAPHPQRWYIRVEAEPQMTTSPLSRVLWRDAKLFQPQGTDALRWQRIITESQMLLYSQPLNQAREARGAAMLNSLWLWGGGRAMPLRRTFEVFGGDCALSGAFALLSGAQQCESLETMLESQSESGLWVLAAAGDALQRGNLYEWREALQKIELETAQPLLKCLQSGRLQRLTLGAPGENTMQFFRLTRGDAWKLWRPERSLARYGMKSAASDVSQLR